MRLSPITTVLLFSLLAGFLGGATPPAGLSLPELLQTLQFFVQLVVIVVAGFMAVKKTLDDADGLNLEKTMLVAFDAASRINDHLKTMDPELRENILASAEARAAFVGPQLENAVKHMEKIRGKTLVGKYLRKGKERVLSLIDVPTPLAEAPAG